MAYGDTFNPAGSARDIKVRGPVWVGVWTFVTLGIYGIWWIYAAAKDLSEYGKAKGYDLGQNPVMTLLAIFPGGLIVVPALIALYRQARRIQQAQKIAGSPDQLNGWLVLILYIAFSPGMLAYEQAELNKAWAAEGGPVERTDGMPARLDSAPSPAASSSSGTAGDPLTAPVTTPEAPSPERPPGT